MCRALSSAHSLPHYAVDRIQWRPNWVRTPEPEFTQAHEALISKERWLIDGYGSWPSVERRISVADTIVFVDHPIWVHYWWATKRQIKSLFYGRPDGPEGCPMFPVTMRLFKMMWWLHREKRPKLIAAEHWSGLRGLERDKGGEEGRPSISERRVVGIVFHGLGLVSVCEISISH